MNRYDVLMHETLVKLRAAQALIEQCWAESPQESADREIYALYREAMRYAELAIARQAYDRPVDDAR